MNVVKGDDQTPENVKSSMESCVLVHSNIQNVAENSDKMLNGWARFQSLPSFGMEHVRCPVDGSVLLDQNGVPISVERMLSTKPLKQDLSTRPGPGNKKLTYMSGEVVTRTLNLVFGFDGWNLNIQNTQREECVQDEKGRWRVVYTALVRVTHIKSGSYREDCGMGDSIDKNMGIAISHAQKASITDAMKRAARHFGEKLGNSLYHGDFNINRAPASLQHALDQLDTERAKLLGKAASNVASHVAVKKEDVTTQIGADLRPLHGPRSFAPSGNVTHPDQIHSSTTKPSIALPCTLQQASNHHQVVAANPRILAPLQQGSSFHNHHTTVQAQAHSSATCPPPALSVATVTPSSNQHGQTFVLQNSVAATSRPMQISEIPRHNPALEGTHSTRTSPLQHPHEAPANIEIATLQQETASSHDAIAAMPPPTSTQGLQSSNLFGNNGIDFSRPSTSVGRKSDPLPRPSDKGCLLLANPMSDATQKNMRVPLSSLPSNGDNDARKKAKINPYA